MNDELKKEVIIIAGGNGVGKTTFARAFLQEYDYEFLNADEIAKSLSAEKSRAKKISAGKLFFQKLDEAIEQGKSLLIETTLSGRYVRKLLKTWRELNYKITIIFLSAASPEILIERVAERVKKGGHYVSDEDVRRRFKRGKENFWSIYKNLADSWSLFYNTNVGFKKIMEGEREKIITFPTIPSKALYIEEFRIQGPELKLKSSERALEFERIGNRAARQAQEENHRLGLPNIYSRNGKIIYEMPDGKIIVKEIPENGSK